MDSLRKASGLCPSQTCVGSAQLAGVAGRQWEVGRGPRGFEGGLRVWLRSLTSETIEF
jgi:hypothetical protein